jgi:Holliday junction resolvasome RuvABC endonuclease subunit
VIINVVGLDLSLTHSAGAHAFGPVSSLERRSFAICSKPKDYEHPLVRLRDMRERLRAELAQCTANLAPGIAMFEGYSFGSKNSQAHSLGEWGSLARMLAHESGWTVVICPPSTLKAYVAGKGNADKALMLREVYKRWKYDAANDNDCDAYALCRLAVDFLGERDALSKERAKLLSKLEPWAALAA